MPVLPPTWSGRHLGRQVLVIPPSCSPACAKATLPIAIAARLKAEEMKVVQAERVAFNLGPGRCLAAPRRRPRSEAAPTRLAEPSGARVTAPRGSPPSERSNRPETHGIGVPGRAHIDAPVPASAGRSRMGWGSFCLGLEGGHCPFGGPGRT
jgi:hypothetical protein